MNRLTRKGKSENLQEGDAIRLKGNTWVGEKVVNRGKTTVTSRIGREKSK